ncbi:MAG: hypothetical protein KAT65_22560 [Methanophagales archaeon]|nr:hypothetical protein [Methanophagales archaeon]
MSKKEAVDIFKEMISDMHRGTPIYYYYGYLEKNIPEKEMRDYFFENHVFIKAKKKGPNNHDAYFLGVNGITLANSYKIEALTESIKKLTLIIVLLTIVLVILTIVCFIPSS